MENEWPVLVRLNTLIKSGYKILENESQSLENSLTLKHPATKRVKYRKLTLDNDGAIFGSSRHVGSDLFIAPEEIVEFRNFVQTIPTPTWWEKSEDIRVSITVWLILGLLFWGPAVWGLYKKYLQA